MPKDQTNTLRHANEWGAIESVLLRHARDAFGDADRIAAQWRELNYLAAPDADAAITEYDRFAALIAGTGAEVHYLPVDDGLTLDSIYVRDAALPAPGGVVLCNMGKPERRGEPAAIGRYLEQAGIPVLGRIEAPGTLEGGDVVWLDAGTLVVGEGYRTNAEGIRQLRALLGEGVEVIVVPLPHWDGPQDVFHLMSMLSPVDRDLAVVYSRPMPSTFRTWLIEERGMTLVETPEEEFASMATNVLAIGPREAVMIEGNPLTQARLEAAGAIVHTFAADEISRKGLGGPTCLSRPLTRAG